MSAELHDFYLGHENGRKLLVGVDIVTEGDDGREDEDGRGDSEVRVYQIFLSGCRCDSDDGDDSCIRLSWQFVDPCLASEMPIRSKAAGWFITRRVSCRDSRNQLRRRIWRLSKDAVR